MAPRRRDALRPYLNRWVTFTAHVAETSTTRGEPTILLTQIYDESGQFMAGHVWIKEALYGASVGDNITFRGHVSMYRKGFRRRYTPNVQRQYDYHIDRIEQIRKIEE